MISVLNRRLLLSGSNYYFFLVVTLLMAACSPKVRQANKAPENTAPKQVEPAPEKEKKEGKRTSSLALILPLKLNKLSAKITEKQVSDAEFSLDFYQGFKLAIDSLSQKGDNFKLQIFDSQDNDTRVVNLAMAKSVTEENDIVIGPIFPAGIKTFSEFAKLQNKVMVSPLAASAPSQFNNPNLITMTNSINQHGWKVADFIVKNYRVPAINVIMVNTRKTEDEKFASPVRKNLASLSKNSIKVNEVSGSAAISEVIDPQKNNLVILTSTDKSYVIPVIDKLYRLSTQDNYKIELFGHPDWIKVQNLDTEKLQWLSTHITSSYFIDTKDKSTKEFISRYKTEFGLEPTEFSFKGFDCGYFFGTLLAKYGSDYTSHLKDLQYEGLENDIKLDFDPRWGYQNAELHMLLYKGYTLQPVK